MIADPLHLLEIVMPCVGGAAFIVANADLARRARNRPVWIRGFGEHVQCKSPDLRRGAAGHTDREAADTAFGMADLTRDQMDMVAIYDCYTITVLLSLEDAGFCEKGKGMEFVANHDLTFRGDFPLNTPGGQLGFGQAGLAGGMHHVCDATRQIMGRAGEAQSPTATQRSSPGTAGSCPSRRRSSCRETDMTTFERPMPVKTPTTAPFWDALAQHRIVIQYSPSSQAYVFYPRVRAPRTLANDLEWREISGMGTLYSYTVALRPVSPHFADAVPQLLAIVEWDEGPRFSTEMVNVDPEGLRVGMRVRPVFVDYPEHEVTLLRYEPAD